MRVSPPLKRIMITKSIRIREELVARMEEQLWNHKYDGIQHGKQAEFFENAVCKELDRLEGKNVDAAIEELAHIYLELAKADRIDKNQLQIIEQAQEILINYRKEGEESAAIK